MTDIDRLLRSLDRFAGLRILCVGDVMLDRFIYGKVTRISPEAPIPVLQVERETEMLGAAGNVLSNIVSLGGRPMLATMIGDDDAGRLLDQLLRQAGVGTDGLLIDPARRTTVKMRFVSGSQQMLRADYETPQTLGASDENRLTDVISSLAQNADGILISDYSKGVVTAAVAQAAVEVARRHGIPVLVDSKPVSYGFFAGATVLKPNRKELTEATGLPADTDEQVEVAALKLLERSKVDALVVTRSEQGVSIISADADPVHMRADTREVFETSGAGDTTLAALALALSCGASLVEAAELANHAAGIVVGKMGTAAVRIAELREALLDQPVQAAHKVKTLDEAVDEAERWRARGVRVGFTNGCFDLLHPGHVSILAQARAACDRLIVGLNSDASVKRLKGETRPVQGEQSRAAVLAALKDVDAVVIFGEETPEQVIHRLRPDVLVKGKDYKVENVVGAEFVMSYGGRVLLADLQEGHSTTGTIKKLTGAP